MRNCGQPISFCMVVCIAVTVTCIIQNASMMFSQSMFLYHGHASLSSLGDKKIYALHYMEMVDGG